MRVNRKRMRPHLPLLIALTAALAIGAPSPAAAQQKITAKVRPAPAPAWNKGIKPVDAESYYNAIECGKQGGDNPACVFWDSGLCANTDYTLAWYTPQSWVLALGAVGLTAPLWVRGLRRLFAAETLDPEMAATTATRRTYAGLFVIARQSSSGPARSSSG